MSGPPHHYLLSLTTPSGTGGMAPHCYIFYISGSQNGGHNHISRELRWTERCLLGIWHGPWLSPALNIAVDLVWVSSGESLWPWICAAQSHLSTSPSGLPEKFEYHCSKMLFYKIWTPEQMQGNSQEWFYWTKLTNRLKDIQLIVW